ncbi:MAG: MFS transporter [Candidatus Lokiarchaeota archaeon]|nr:MFS transporter [Candidatus Lokiarchaeota archaeon]
MSDERLVLDESVPRKVKLSLGLGSFANGFLNGFPFANMTFFYEQKVGLEGELVGYAWLIFAIWNTLNDPLISYVIDNTRTRIGRRIPYIRYGSVLYVAAFLFCWFPIATRDNQIGLFFNFLGALFLLDTIFTFVGCCFFSLPNEIAVTAKQRASLTIYSSVFGFVNLALGLLLPIVLLTDRVGVDPLFLPTMVILGATSGVILFASSFGLKENMFAQEQPHEGFVEGLRETLKNKPFWLIMIPAFLLSILVPLIQTGLLYYIDYVAAGRSILPALACFVILVVVGVVVFTRLLEKWQVKKTAIACYYVFSAGFAGIFLLGMDVTLVSIPMAVMGFAFAGGLICNGVVMGDVIDNDELITGKRREAIYGGVNAIVTKPGISIANWGFLSIISAFGFVPPKVVGEDLVKQPQPPSVAVGILVALALLPLAGTLVSAVALRWYPLDGPDWLRKKKYLMDLHVQKEREYLEGRRQAGNGGRWSPRG